jgi:HCOMODA/2-hydroxy-3-carboxy-muconic semialdehyde decarboxylase
MAKMANAPDPELIQQIVDANRILTNEGVLDGFGHVSARHDKDPGRFLLARNLAPALVTAEDLQEYDLESNTRDTRRAYLEKFIHGEIYRARPDVMAVVHSHSPSIIPFGITGERLRPVFHMCGFLGGPVPVFEIRDAGGLETNMLVRSRELGAALAKSLGDRPFALMRGHGSVAVGPSVKHAVYRAIYAEINARLQQDALLMGDVTYLNEAEAANADAANMTVLDRPWELWKARLTR